MNQHPWKILKELLKSKSLTQRQFAQLIWKKVSEVNELINSKRNITVQWDILLSHFLWTEPKYWLNLQNDYDYELAQESFNKDLLEKDKQEHEDIETLYKKPIQVASDRAQKLNKKEEEQEALSYSVMSKNINPTETNQVKKISNKPHNISKENQNNDKEKIFSQPNYNLNKEDNLDKDSKNLQKIEKINSLSKQRSSNLDSSRNPTTTSNVGPEWQEKKDKYFYQMIYREDDKFDSYFSSKDKIKQHWSKLNNIDKHWKNKKNPPVLRNPHPLSADQAGFKKEDKKLDEKKDYPKDHHKYKERIFRNF